MSSSDHHPQARSFLRWLAGLGAIGIAALVASAALADPRGLVAAAFPQMPRLCADGISVGERDAAPFIVAAHRPREILLGSSRVMHGFAAADLNGLLEPPVANLALPSATVPELDGLATMALDRSAVERIWFGVDFGMFHLPDENDQIDRWARDDGELDLPMDVPLPLMALLHGLAEPKAWRAALGAYLNGDCKRPPRDLLGFGDPRVARLQPHDLGTAAAGLEARYRRAAPDPQRYRERLDRLDRLIERADAKGVEVILFVNPSHPLYHRAIGRAGLAGAYGQWRRDLATIALRHANTTFVDLDAVPVEAVPGACLRSGRQQHCPFVDLTHYRPRVGRRIVETVTAAR